MSQIELTYNEAVTYASLFHAGVGLLLGLIPLILGFIKKKQKYGFIGFLGSIIGGAILGIFLSVPIAAICTWLILKKPTPEISSGSNEVS